MSRPCFPVANGTMYIRYEVYDHDERKPNAKFVPPTAGGKWAGDSSSHNRRNVSAHFLPPKVQPKIRLGMIGAYPEVREQE